MLTPDVRKLLQVWECGVHLSPTARAVLLFGAALPDVEETALLHAAIGHRDAWLLQLREALFGSRFDCVMSCPACAERLELTFAADDIRAPHGAADCVCALNADLRFRLPTSADLLALEDEADIATARQQLLQRCRLPPASSPATSPATPSPALPPPAMPPHAPLGLDAAQTAQAARALRDADPQAEVLLDLRCPACDATARQPFDIAAHLWSELDHWARGMLQQVHLLASRYGWSEGDILALTPVRRQHYLQMRGAA